jgi:membrane protein implicated in regulation of membrane protease activity
MTMTNLLATRWDQIAALALVAIIAALGVRRWLKQRRAGQSSCGACASAKRPANEQPLQFFRRRPE